LNQMHIMHILNQHSISLARGDGPELHQPSLHVGPEQEHGLDEVRFEASPQSVMRSFIAENSRSTLTCVTGSAARTSLQGFAASTYLYVRNAHRFLDLVCVLRVKICDVRN
jgi:hypothetical protein